MIPGLAQSPGGGHGTPLQYSCLENPMDRGAWRLQSLGSQRIGHDRETKHSNVYKLPANTLPFYIRALSICGFRCHWGSWNQSPGCAPHSVCPFIRGATLGSLPSLATVNVVAAQLLGPVWLLVTPVGCRDTRLPCHSLSPRSLLKCVSTESVMLSDRLILCHHFLLSPSVSPSIRVFSSESTAHIR